MGGYTSKCEKKSKSLHPTGHVFDENGEKTGQYVPTWACP